MSDQPRDNPDQQRDGDAPEGAPPPPSIWEWVVAALGLLLVVGTVGYLGFVGVTSGDEAPAMVLETRSVRAVEDGYLVEVEVRNRGSRTAAGLTIEGELTGGGGKPETSDTTLDYVPGRSERRAGLFFTRDPRQADLKLRAKGYQEP